MDAEQRITNAIFCAEGEHSDAQLAAIVATKRLHLHACIVAAAAQVDPTLNARAQELGNADAVHDVNAILLSNAELVRVRALLTDQQKATSDSLFRDIRKAERAIDAYMAGPTKKARAKRNVMVYLVHHKLRDQMLI